jgi:hypothetical protein
LIAITGVKIISQITYLSHKPMQIIYASQPLGYDSATLQTILDVARKCNARDNVSGALVCRQDIYLQLLEGSLEAVNATYMRICGDDRHVGIKKLVSRRASKRFFSNWAMLHDPAISLIWNQQQISAGILDCVPQSEIIGMFEAISHRSDLNDFDH